MIDRVITLRETIRGVAERWKQQYFKNGDWRYDDKQHIFDELKKLDLNTASKITVDGIIGNRSWTNVECSECGYFHDAVRECGATYNYESATAMLCRDCLKNALDELEDALADKGRCV